MKTIILLATVAVIASGSLLPMVVQTECSPQNWKACKGKPWVDGETMETPLGSKWWPNPLWGEGDEAGSTNWYTKQEVVLRALAQVTEGKVYRLGQEYSHEMPLLAHRSFALRIPSAPTHEPAGANNAVYHDEFLATEIGQVGTQFDGLGHAGVQVGAPGDKVNMRWYNGFSGQEINRATGLLKLGTEKLHPIVARGILLDVAGSKGVEFLEPGYVITMDDVRAALLWQEMEDFEFQPGDALLFRTGWEKFWVVDNKRYNGGEPGIGMEVARWVAEIKAGVTGADNWGVEVIPHPDPACVGCVHNFLQTRHGIVNQENLTLAELARDGAYVFLYVFIPVPIKGATGSIGSPIAVR